VKVLGIDPGSQLTGWGLLGGSAARPRLIEAGVIRLGSRQHFAQRLALLQGELRSLVERLAPTVAAVEAPFHGASARSALQLAHARGVILAVLAAAEVEVVEYAPAVVKKTVTGNGRADKEQVAAMVRRSLALEEGPLAHDLTDALAVALSHLAASRFNDAVRRAGRSATPPGADR
jgi:crossover junction endodeoxyribonuclease RuvC